MPNTNRLNELLRVDEHTGLVYWRHNNKEVAKRANKTRYKKVTIDGKCYLLHRVVYKMIHGVEPVGYIDHANRDRYDNRPVNLRDATPLENSNNRAPGEYVHYKPQRDCYAVWVRHDQQQVYLGSYKTKQEAEDARDYWFMELAVTV